MKQCLILIMLQLYSVQTKRETLHFKWRGNNIQMVMKYQVIKQITIEASKESIIIMRDWPGEAEAVCQPEAMHVYNIK